MLLQGIIALALGILLLTYPTGVIVLLTLIIGIYWMIDGIFVLASLYTDRSDREWKILIGILGIIAGVLVLTYPLYDTTLTPTTLATMVGAAGLIMGIIHLARGLSGAGYGSGAIGIVSIIFGLILTAHPYIATPTLVTILAIIALIGGGVVIVYTLWLSR